MDVPLNETFYFDIVTHDTTGALSDADSTPTWEIYEESSTTPIQSGDFSKRAIGNYYGSVLVSLGNGFDVGSFHSAIGYAVVGGVAGKTVVDRFRCVHEENQTGVSVADMIAISGIPTAPTNIVDANLVQVSGEPIIQKDVVDSNVVQVSGDPVQISDFRYQDTSIYFADINYIYDGTNNQDEYTTQWFKDSQPISSGDLTTPTLSVYNTINGTAVIEHQSMDYASTTLGVVRYNEATNMLASGEPYLAVASGTIDSQVRTWKTIIGINTF